MPLLSYLYGLLTCVALHVKVYQPRTHVPACPMGPTHVRLQVMERFQLAACTQDMDMDSCISKEVQSSTYTSLQSDDLMALRPHIGIDES